MLKSVLPIAALLVWTSVPGMAAQPAHSPSEIAAFRHNLVSFFNANIRFDQETFPD